MNAEHRSQVLTINQGGVPVGWIGWQEAVTLYAREAVRWEAGEDWFTVMGGWRGDGRRSTLRVNSIISIAQKASRFERTPPLTLRTLMARDRVCLYCGLPVSNADASIEHIVPKRQGGVTRWTNCCLAHKRCNNRKGGRSLAQAKMQLVAVPYKPDFFAHLLLVASGRVKVDQQAWIESFARKDQRLS